MRRQVPRLGPCDRFLPGLILRQRFTLRALRVPAKRGRRDHAPSGDSSLLHKHPVGSVGRARSDGPILPEPCPCLRQVLPATRGLCSRHFFVLPRRSRLRTRPCARASASQARADPCCRPGRPLLVPGPGWVRRYRGQPRPPGVLNAGAALLLRRAPAATQGGREDGAGAPRRFRLGRGAAGREGKWERIGSELS